MKKLSLLILIFALSIIAAGCVEQSNTGKTNGEKTDEVNAVDAASKDDKIVLTLSSGLSTANGWWEGYFTPWMKKVEEKTDGRVEFEYYANQELIPINEELQALENGTIDIAAPLWTLYDPQRFPLSEVTMLPLLGSDPLIATKAYGNLVKSDSELADGKTFVEMEYNDRGLKVFATPTTAEYVISTKDHPLDTVDDFKSLTLRSPTRVHEIFAKNVGINTITMPSTEMFDAINRGAFQGAFFSVADWTGFGMQDVFNYTFEGVNLGHFSGMWAMTEDNWNKIPEDIQKIMEETSYEQILDGAKLWMDRAEDIRTSAESNGAVFEKMGDVNEEAQAMLLKGIEDTWFEWIEGLEKNGKPGKEMAILWRDLVVEEGGSVPDSIMELK